MASTPHDLLEREAEVAALHAAVAVPEAGDGALVLLEGPAGVGKTRLLDELRALSASSGLQVLSAAGSELERDVPFGLVRQLLDPVVLGPRGEPREELFAGAAALSRSVFAFDEVGQPRLGPQLLYGLYWLVSEVADTGAVGLLVDDVQLGDPQSVRFLAFLARRLEGLPVLVGATCRTGDPGTEEAELLELRAAPGVRVLRPQPLSLTAAGVVAERLFHQAAEEDFVRACHAATGGNPLLLGQALRTLAGEGASPTSSGVSALQRLAPGGVADAVLQRLRMLGPVAEAVIRAAAVLGDGAAVGDVAGLTGVAADELEQAVDALVRTAILRDEPALSFVHPIVRQAIYESISPRRRAELHGAAAALLMSRGAASDRVAAHLLHTEPGGDAHRVRILRDAARRARARGAADAAARFLRRALDEPPPADVEAELLLEAGTAEREAGQPQALEHLRSAYELAPDAGSRLAATAELAVALTVAGRFDEARDVLTRTLNDLEDADAEAVLEVEARIATNAMLAGAMAPGDHERMSALAARLGDESPAARQLLAAEAQRLSALPVPWQQAVAVGRRALGGGRLLQEETADSPVFWFATSPLLAADLDEEHEELVQEAFRDVRARGSLLGHATCTAMRGAVDLARGRVREAEEMFRTVLGFATSAGFETLRGLAGAELVRALVELDELDAADALLREGRLDAELPPGAGFERLLVARGHLRLEQDAADRAVADFEDVTARQAKRGVRPPVAGWNWRPGMVAALVRLGRLEEAQQVAAEARALAEEWGSPRPRAYALRAAALAAAPAERLALLEEAREALQGRETLLLEARIELDRGSELRRQRQRVAAREPLRRALELARTGGGARVGAQAVQELAATGERRTYDPYASGAESLTPQERRVAEMAAAGVSNKEIAQALFVTLKTVEVHLSRAYRKLDITSRAQLPEKLGATARSG